jgi:hypothetical protein
MPSSCAADGVPAEVGDCVPLAEVRGAVVVAVVGVAGVAVGGEGGARSAVTSAGNASRTRA